MPFCAEKQSWDGGRATEHNAYQAKSFHEGTNRESRGRSDMISKLSVFDVTSHPSQSHPRPLVGLEPEESVAFIINPNV